MNELEKILDGLIRRTSDGQLRWSSTAIRNQFATSIDTISVVIGQATRGQGGIVGEPRLEIFNEHGDLAEVIQVEARSSTTEQDEKLNHLHQLARRSALNIQETLEKLAKALEE